MASRQSKTGSRSSSRGRGSRSSGKSARRARSHSHSRSASASARGGSGSNTRRAAGRRGARQSRPSAARAKRGRRAGASASYAVKLLQQDHRAVAEALRQFESAGREEKQAIANRVCRMLTVHSQIEEELLYPAARDALDGDEAHLVAEARVEHASLKDLIRQIEDREQVDEQYEAKVTVLGEYVKHHVAEEEKELFPKLERSSLDLQALGERLQERKRELMGEPQSGERPETMSGSGALPPRMTGGTARDEEGELAGASGARSRGGRGHGRSAGLHARRR